MKKLDRIKTILLRLYSMNIWVFMNSSINISIAIVSLQIVMI